MRASSSGYKPPRSLVTSDSPVRRNEMKRAQTRMGWLFSAAAIVIIGAFVFLSCFLCAVDEFYQCDGI